MRREAEITQQGCIKVRSIIPVQISRKVIIWEIDMDSKYVDVGLGDYELYLQPNDSTLHMHDDYADEATVIKLPISGKWSIIADSHRYTVIVVAYREKN